MALRGEDPRLIICVINFELVQPICPRYNNVTDGRTDGRTAGRTTYDGNTALALRALRGKNCCRGDHFSISHPYFIRIFGMFPLDQIADLGALMCEDSRLIIRVNTFEVTKPIITSIHQRHRWTNGETDNITIAIERYAYVHRALITRKSNGLQNKKAVLSQGNRAMPHLFFSV